jgi:hypothetical protein
MKKMRIHEINLEFGEQVTLQIMRTSKDDINELGLQPFTINDPGSLSGVPKKYLVR